MLGASATITISRPPPSVDRCWRNVKGVGRAVTAEYKHWKAEAYKELMCQRPFQMFSGRVTIVIDVAEGLSHADPDNLAKPVVDMLVEMAVIGGDSPKYVKRVSCGYEDGVSGVVVRVSACS